MTQQKTEGTSPGMPQGGPLEEAARGWLRDLFAPWVQALALQVQSVDARQAVLRLPFSDALCRQGGTICGQALMSAADTAMVIAIAGSFGEFRPMTTVTLNTSFMRAVSGGDVILTARMLKPGRTMVFGEVEMAGVDGRLAAHVTTTYALL